MADEVDTPQFTPEEVAALADEAHRLRKKLAVHCHGDQAAKEAIAAGVDSIEHGSFMKPETLTLMKAKGTYLVATLMATEWIMGKLDQYPPPLQAKAKAAAEARTEMFRNAVRLGVKIAFGTDAAVFPHGQNAKEFALMTGLGMEPIEALALLVTSVTADLRHLAKGWNARKRQARRYHRHPRRSHHRHHRNRARLLRDEGRADREEQRGLTHGAFAGAVNED